MPTLPGTMLVTNIEIANAFFAIYGIFALS